MAKRLLSRRVTCANQSLALSECLGDCAGFDEGMIKRMEEDVKGMAKRALRAVCLALGVDM